MSFRYTKCVFTGLWLQNWGFSSIKYPHTYNWYLRTCPVSLSPLPVPRQLPLSEARPFTFKITKFCAEFWHFFQWLRTIPLSTPLASPLRDWNKDAWRASTESSHSQKHFEILQLEMGRKKKVLPYQISSGLFYYASSLIPWKLPALF